MDRYYLFEVIAISICQFIQYRMSSAAKLRAAKHIRARSYGGAASVPLYRLTGGVHGVAKRFCGSPCAPI
eukprot:1558250-Pleurochrysis_carterae.AAC.1